MKIIKIKQSDITRIVETVINEQGFSLIPYVSTAYNALTGSSNTSKTPSKENINPKNLKLGAGGNSNPSQINDVKKLQQKLMDLKLLKTDTMVPTGYFGEKTQQALNKYNNTGSSTSGKVSGTSGKVSGTSGKTKEKEVAKLETGDINVLKPNASLLFDGDYLYWVIDGVKVKSWSATSGLTWKNTPASDWGKLLNRYTQNRQEWSKQKNAGPLPEGKYSAGPLETRTGEPVGGLQALWLKVTGQASDTQSRDFGADTNLSKISWGNYRLRITPTGNQDMYGRNAFYIHGGAIAGSHGCIDLTDEMEEFAKFFSIWSSSTNKRTIPLTVKYKNPAINTVISKLTNLF